jgi:glycine dehydrogenase subunit 1
MAYIPNTTEDQQAMLEAIGCESIDELFEMVPQELRLDRPLDVPDAMGEMELTAHLERLGGESQPAAEGACFLGAGSYDHFIPTVVDFVASRSEFYTAYTPYQPEASQGSLQVFFEYQTLITRLTGMDVSNASLYDGATAAAEAVLMAMNVTRRDGKVIVPENVHPEYRQVLRTYLTNFDTELVELPVVDTAEGNGSSSGTIARNRLAEAIDDETACVLIQHPNFFGCLEDVQSLAEVVHEAGAVLAVIANPISLGLLASPGDLGADVVVAEGQPLGVPMSFGGPYLGVFAASERFVRRLPGRLVGQTVDRRGKPCWVLTLQTREQHIRREKATSNICTNQGLLALRATTYLAAMGPTGLRKTAELCLQKAHYAAEQIGQRGGDIVFSSPWFHEFVVRVGKDRVDPLLEAGREAGIFPGVPLRRWYPALEDCLLVAVTERRTREQIDRLAELLAG